MQDDTPAIQALIDTGQCIPPGQYNLYSPLILAEGQTLCGSGRFFDMNSRSLYGTVLNIHHGSGEGTAEDRTKAAVQMRPCTKVTGVAFNYPAQTEDLDQPVEFAPTVAMLPAPGGLTNPYHGDVHIRDVMFYKSYTAIDARGGPIEKFITTHRYENILMTALAFGIRMEAVTDWCVLDTIEQQPGFIGHKLNLRHWVQSNGTFLDFHGKMDWIHLDHCMAWATALGVKFTDAYGPASFNNCDFDGSLVGAYIQGACAALETKFNNCTFTCFNALTGEQPGFVIVPATDTVLKDTIFNACHLFGPSNGWGWFGSPGVSASRFILNGCTTDVHGVPTEALHLNGNLDDVLIVASTFKGVTDYHNGSHDDAKVVGCTLV